MWIVYTLVNSRALNWYRPFIIHLVRFGKRISNHFQYFKSQTNNNDGKLFGKTKLKWDFFEWKVVVAKFHFVFNDFVGRFWRNKEFLVHQCETDLTSHISSWTFGWCESCMQPLVCLRVRWVGTDAKMWDSFQSRFLRIFFSFFLLIHRYNDKKSKCVHIKLTSNIYPKRQIRAFQPNCANIYDGSPFNDEERKEKFLMLITCDELMLPHFQK